MNCQYLQTILEVIKLKGGRWEYSLSIDICLRFQFAFGCYPIIKLSAQIEYGKLLYLLRTLISFTDSLFRSVLTLVLFHDQAIWTN